MLLSKIGYYADFVVYPLLLVPLGSELARQGAPYDFAAWTGACLAGMLGFSLLEYALHRFLLHHVPPFRGMHELHHAHPTALVGTPTIASVALIAVGIFAPAWYLAGLNIACGFTFGIILGYLCYGLVHHAVHRRSAPKGSYMHRVKRRHAQHHHARQACNFGVTTDCWDRVFGTAVLPAGSPAHPARNS